MKKNNLETTYDTIIVKAKQFWQTNNSTTRGQFNETLYIKFLEVRKLAKQKEI